jgi:hypothetical protein
MKIGSVIVLLTRASSARRGILQHVYRLPGSQSRREGLF